MSMNREEQLAQLEESVKICRQQASGAGTHADLIDQDQRLERLGDALFALYSFSETLEGLVEVISVYDRVLHLRPAGHPHRATSVIDLGRALWFLCKSYVRDDELLARCISLNRELVQLFPAGHPDHWNGLNDLANALFTRFEQQGGEDTLREAFALYRDALRLCPDGLPFRDMLLNNVATAMLTGYKQYGGADTLAEVISLHSEALTLRPHGHPHRDMTLNNLANSFLLQYEVEGVTDFLEAAITFYREALALRPRGHSSRDVSLHNLGNALVDHFETHGDAGLLNEAMILHREALGLRPEGHPLRDKSLNSLAYDLFTFSDSGLLGVSDTLAEATSLSREALALRPSGHPLRVTSLLTLASTLAAGFGRSGSADVFAEAVALYREALELCSPDYVARDKVLNSLAGALYTRYVQHGGLDNLSEAIALYREALELRQPGHRLRSASLNNLGNALSAKYIFSGDMTILDEVLILYREALKLNPLGHPSRHRSLHNLATELLSLYMRDGDADSLAECIALSRDALELRATDHSLRHRTLGNLAEALIIRHSSHVSGDQSQSPEALLLVREAMEICAPGHPDRSWLLYIMANCLLSLDNAVFDFSRGVAYISEGLSHGNSTVHGRLQGSVRALRALENAYPAAMRDCDAEMKGAYSDRVLALYAQAVQLLPLVANFGLRRAARLEAVEGLEELSRNGAARALALGRVPEAVEMLEEGRGVFWTQALRLRAPGIQLEDVAEADRAALQRTFEALDAGDPSLSGHELSPIQREQALEMRRKLNVEAEEIIARIRTHPKLQRFLMPATFDSLRESLPDGIVAVINASRLGHHVLLLWRAKGLATSLEVESSCGGFDSLDIETVLSRRLGVGEGSDDTSIESRAIGIARKRPEGHFESLLLTLWTDVVSPVIKKLGLKVSRGIFYSHQPHTDCNAPIKEAEGRARPRIWWCVTGQLGFLPIHAAGKYSGNGQTSATNYVVSSYTPTLATLARARAQWRPIPFARLAGMMICETASGRARLNSVLDEVRIVEGCLKTAGASVLNTPSAHTSLTQMNSLPWTDTPPHIVHLACHGVQDPDPLKSAFLLEDGRLTIEDIMKFDMSSAVLGYLSACETAKGSKTQPDQAVHLAASMLFCGFRSVIGTMWSVQVPIPSLGPR
jgi:tetratricopeptide (TPR) repeat protein